MTDDPIFNQLCELSWRRKLTGAEEAELRAWLAAHPEAQADWRTEAGLNSALGRLPDVPVPSNFTARVLQAVEREAAAELRRGEPQWQFWRRRRWLPGAAFAAVILGAGLFSYHQFHAARLREYVNSVAAVSDVSSLPSPEVLKDFDAIRASSPRPLPDEQLLAVLE
jgi:ferric-dicitrate binding protein FerR (iron transport regulator)